MYRKVLGKVNGGDATMNHYVYLKVNGRNVGTVQSTDSESHVWWKARDTCIRLGLPPLAHPLPPEPEDRKSNVT